LKFPHAFRPLLLLLCTAPFDLAQSPDATMSGVVVDTTGRAIPDAAIEILNDATDVHYSRKTNGIGIYTVSALPPGQYRVQVSKAGFKTLIKPDVVLNVQSALSLNFTLPVGATSESITVEAGTSRINTSDASVSTVVDEKFVANIPLNGRSFQDLIAMTPGVVTQSPQASSVLGYNGDFSVNGQRTQSNYYLVDGVSANTGAGNGTGAPQPGTGGTIASSTALGTTQSLISVDALREFRVLSSTYSAEFGRSPGGQFSLVTRSGTNRPHGTVFDYVRNNFFDANDWFNDHNDKPLTALRQNDFGATLGAPIFLPRLYDGRNRSFLFASYEGLRLTQPRAASIQYVPDTCLRQKAPASLQPILNAYPIQNGVDYGTCNATVTSPSLAQFIEPYSLPSQIDSTSVRIDQVFSPKLTVFVRASYTPSSVASRTLSAVTTTRANTQTYTLGATSQLTNNITNELRVGYSRSRAAQTTTLDSFGGATPTDLAGTVGLGGSDNPGVESFLSFAGIGTSVLFTSATANSGDQWNAIDTVSLTQRRHQLKFGVDCRSIRSPLTPFLTSANAEYLSASSLLSNSATATILQKYNQATPVFNEIALFAQDEYHVAASLTLSLGLRWELDPPPTEENGRDAYTVLGDINDPATLVLAPQGTALWKTSHYNVAPRLGLAWIAHARPGWETVVRSGGGVFFDTDNEVATDGYSALGFRAFQVIRGNALPVTSSQLNFSTAVAPPYTTVYAFPTHLQLPYTLQWNASLEQALGKEQSLTISYVGSNGRRLLQIQEKSIASLNPAFTAIAFVQGGVTSNYQALQLKFQRNVTKGVQALVSYGWSHSLDFGSNSSALPLTRGDSDFDVRHNLEGGLSWDLPSTKSSRLLQSLTNGWAVDGRLIARTAFPITLQGSLLVDPATGNQYYGNVNLVAGKPFYLYSEAYPGGRALNRAAFATPTGGNSGDAPRNFLRGFGEAQVNAAVRRQFPIREGVSLQFRAEAFNILNHPNFGYVDPTLTDATFGQATAMLNQSLGTVSAQYQQGGARSMQFALKLQF
jgi:hypothetical protein